MGVSLQALFPMTTAEFLPSSAARVEHSTADEVNAQVEPETAARIDRIASAGQGAIARQFRELDREWDIERTLEAHAATVSLVALHHLVNVRREAGFNAVNLLQGYPSVRIVSPLELIHEDEEV